MDLLCNDFMKIEPLVDGKEDVLVLTNAFTKLSQALVTKDQKAITIIQSS